MICWPPFQRPLRGYVLLGYPTRSWRCRGGAGAWIYQIETGIGQTNLHPPIFWTSYIASFVYWIGVSHSGTFISGVLAAVEGAMAQTDHADCRADDYHLRDDRHLALCFIISAGLEMVLLDSLSQSTGNLAGLLALP